MGRRPRRRLLYAGLLALPLLLSLVGCGPPQSGSTTTAITLQPQVQPGTTPFTPAGAAVWILSCQDGWAKQKIYQDNPYYTDQDGIQHPRDLYVFGHFWLQPTTGQLLSSAAQPALAQCLNNLITTAHLEYHAQICGVISVNEGPGGWKSSDVVAYTRRAVANPALLTPLIEQAKRYPYDCIINDIEDGNNTDPQIFSQYDALLHSKLSVPLGQTLLWKTSAVQTYWQRWEDWRALANKADFFIVMALDQDSIHNPPVPSSIVNAQWVRQIYAYARSVTPLFGSRPLAWELPTYYRLFTRQANGSWAVSAGTDVASQLTTALHSPTILHNLTQDANDPSIEYVNAHGQSTYLFFETASSSDTLARTLTTLNGSSCLRLSFWDNDSGTSTTLGWSTVLNDADVHLC